MKVSVKGIYGKRLFHGSKKVHLPPATADASTDIRTFVSACSAAAELAMDDMLTKADRGGITPTELIIVVSFDDG